MGLSQESMLLNQEGLLWRQPTLLLSKSVYDTVLKFWMLATPFSQGRKILWAVGRLPPLITLV